MNVGTAIFAVGLMLFTLALIWIVLLAVIWRRANSEHEASLKEFESARESIRRGGRRSDARFKL